MDVIDKIKQELERGFTKRELENLMGIPKNNLSGILKEQKKISAKGLIRIQKYFDLEVKPDPSEKIERNNPFINAARGRDKCGVNLDEIKTKTTKDNKTQASEVKVEKTGKEMPQGLSKSETLKWLRNNS